MRRPSARYRPGVSLKRRHLAFGADAVAAAATLVEHPARGGGILGCDAAGVDLLAQSGDEHRQRDSLADSVAHHLQALQLAELRRPGQFADLALLIVGCSRADQLWSQAKGEP